MERPKWQLIGWRGVRMAHWKLVLQLSGTGPQVGRRSNPVAVGRRWSKTQKICHSVMYSWRWLDVAVLFSFRGRYELSAEIEANAHWAILSWFLLLDLLRCAACKLAHCRSHTMSVHLAFNSVELSTIPELDVFAYFLLPTPRPFSLGLTAWACSSSGVLPLFLEWWTPVSGRDSQCLLGVQPIEQS